MGALATPGDPGAPGDPTRTSLTIRPLRATPLILTRTVGSPRSVGFDVERPRTLAPVPLPETAPDSRATAAAVAGSFGSTRGAVDPAAGEQVSGGGEPGPGFAAGIRVIARTNSTVVPYPNPGAIARESIR
jgi:hypothetical protein